MLSVEGVEAVSASSGRGRERRAILIHGEREIGVVDIKGISHEVVVEVVVVSVAVVVVSVAVSRC